MAGGLINSGQRSQSCPIVRRRPSSSSSSSLPQRFGIYFGGGSDSAERKCWKDLAGSKDTAYGYWNSTCSTYRLLRGSYELIDFKKGGKRRKWRETRQYGSCIVHRASSGSCSSHHSMHGILRHCMARARANLSTPFNHTSASDVPIYHLHLHADPLLLLLLQNLHC